VLDEAEEDEYEEEDDTEDLQEEEDEEYDEEEDDFEEEDDDEDSPVVSAKRIIEIERIPLFEKTEEQIESFSEEIGNLSKKKPDGPLNKFKVGLLNYTLINANSFLQAEYRPFPSFEQFDDDELPTASDVVTILAQYIRSMNLFRMDHSYYKDYGRWWRTAGDTYIRAKEEKKFKT